MSQMTEEWALFWRQCLTENLTYSEYCSAVARGDKKTCARLAKTFPLLPELVKDFGPSLGWPRGGVSGEDWREWFEPKRHLFMQAVEQLGEGAKTEQTEGYVLLRVPLQPTVTATTALVRNHLNYLYSMAPPAPAPSPKYQLYLRRQRVASGYKRVKQAVHTSTVSYAIDEHGEYVSVRQAIVNFLLDEHDSMGWRMNTPAKAALMKKGGDRDDAIYEKFRVRVDRARRDFVALSQNALHGRFPDLTPRDDSEVIDQFWGE